MEAELVESVSVGVLVSAKDIRSQAKSDDQSHHRPANLAQARKLLEERLCLGLCQAASLDS
jgi:hypothetical protein